ncbi:hypothetical protein [Vandammella animalimorsus]|uniref:Uncharacterized protein n=1 Tax=Vandammella animalimorsus TaxID=2029117 RepID=A0A2A2A4L4_9BURK|nr:hypothetical protein [Vandammella animalimorsus]PAT32889.1 hypothetical protein CK620_13530 [Vandammella animalimorsus]
MNKHLLEQMLREWDGLNTSELAVRYGLSERDLRKAISEARRGRVFAPEKKAMHERIRRAAFEAACLLTGDMPEALRLAQVMADALAAMAEAGQLPEGWESALQAACRSSVPLHGGRRALELMQQWAAFVQGRAAA